MTDAHIRLRPARIHEHQRLSDIARAAKAHWGYPPEWLALWRDELTITPAQIQAGEVICAELDGELAGVIVLEPAAPVDDATVAADASAAEAEPLPEAEPVPEPVPVPVPEIDGLWVLPSAMGRGVGSALLRDLGDRLRRAGHTRLRIVADPHAAPFYERHGARRAGLVPSRPAGRSLPLYYLAL
ncbi:GNAT family N-acetyltransferase [Haliangium sp.]|uniref:GNAT family N-acetyltransferase n=1 Tax=Haliangium sp. TaxID=2663208 RepID=UPI003D0D6D35